MTATIQQWCARTIVSLTVACLCATLDAADSRETWRDDADLHAVHFVGKAIGWTVGDHGVALRTADGGRTWEPHDLPADLSFRAVYVLTDNVGWAAGATTTPYTGVETGSLYRTDDAGLTWKKVNTAPLPRLHAMRFFNERDGIAAGAVTAGSASGVLTTSDGGATWQSAQSILGTQHAATRVGERGAVTNAASTGDGFNAAGWRAAAFPTPDRGAVVGPRGRRAVIGDGQLLPSREATPGLRGLNAVAFTDARTGWAAGDGGTILRTLDGGLVWQDPPATLPEDARKLFDLHALDAVGSSIWAAGRPGSVVWRSSDGGATWQSLPTGSPLPIHALDFSTPTDGVAVGAMGLVLRTIDGGTTWKAARAAERRAALMTVAGHGTRVPFSLVATLAGDAGYRTVTVLPLRPDRQSDGTGLDLRTHDAVIAAGGNAAVTDWPLPISIPGVDREQDALVAEWNRATEGKLEEVLVGRLVASLRTWRPDVVVIDEAAPGDAAGQLLVEATKLAITQAGDPTRYLSQRAALAPWRVKKAYLRLQSGEPADDVIERDGVLSRIGLSVADVAGPAAARLGVVDVSGTSRETYRLIPLEGDSNLAKPFFGGLAIATGSDARRAVGEPLDRARATTLANRQQAIRKYAATSFDDPRQAAGLLARIDDLSVGLTPAQAARQLYVIAEAHRERSQWDLAERTYVALIERYPGEPPSREAMTWLLRLWTGAEPVWRRMQRFGTQKELKTGSIETLAARIDRAFQMAEEGTPATTPEEIQRAGLEADPVTSDVSKGTLQVGAGLSWNDAQVQHWREQAVRLGGLIRKTDPALFATAEVQLPLAVAARSSGRANAAALQAFGPEGLNPTSNAEMILARPEGSSRSSVAICRRTAEPPQLDGVFSDLCWRNAKEVRLETDASHPLPDGILALLAHDDKFLYLAASLPRVPGRDAPPIELAGRTHDADLTGHDRLVLSLDLDRDFATYFRFAVDQRGLTAEDCWGDLAWNPNWFASVTGDEHRWRVEAAIPLSELSPRLPQAGEMWAISLARIAPAVGVQGWPRPNDGEARSDSFGMMRFE
ncbi:MAG: YCF48-related protein [Planctomycetota bacterium]|nr:hypothetical protein [Planctomycetaceae bacterium]MDQ3330175.1 YCF48-related protein [Planctomycetota bacterium]